MRKLEQDYINNTPKVTLISATEDIVPTLLTVWENSKLTKEMMIEKYGVDWVTKQAVHNWIIKSLENHNEAMKTVRKISAASIPVSKMVSFVFEFRNTSTIFRDHLVRHTGLTGVWARSNRLGDLSEYEFYMPELIKANPEAREVFLESTAKVREMYNDLRNLGVMDEDCRDILPVAHLQNITANLSLHTLAHIIKVRSGWFASEFWLPIVAQMIDEIRRIKGGDMIADGLIPKVDVLHHPDEVDAMTRFPALDDPQGPRVDSCPPDPILYNILLNRGIKIEQYHKYILPKAYEKAVKLKNSISRIWTGEALTILLKVMCFIDTPMSYECESYELILGDEVLEGYKSYDEYGYETSTNPTYLGKLKEEIR